MQIRCGKNTRFPPFFRRESNLVPRRSGGRGRRVITALVFLHAGQSFLLFLEGEN